MGAPKATAARLRFGIPGRGLGGIARFVPLVAATAFVAERAIAGVLAKVGHPGASLDDAYIHFQYARAIAEGHPLRFFAGEPISTGATSFLWPAILAPFWLVGFRGESILWPAWIFSFVALGAVAYETYALARPLAGRGPAIGAGAMVIGFGGLVWCAASGMEVVPFAWIITHAARRAVAWSEIPERRTRAELWRMLAIAVVCPLMRPEGALSALALGAVVLWQPPPRVLEIRGVDASRGVALGFGLAALAPNLLLLVLTGSATSSTAQVKLLPGNPYAVLPDAVIANMRLLVGTILDGEVWSAEFLPKGGAIIACAGLVAVAWCGWSTQRHVRAAFVLLLALSMLVPCFYVTFLWNRLRYLWPFAPGWFIGLACLARAVGAVMSRLDRRVSVAASVLVAGAFAGMLAVRLEWVLEDVAQSASAIDRQQATLGRWAKENLPADARIGVNDTGAIAYFGARRTFDVVGLTTPSEARYWVAGSASRFEHYERLHAETPSALPTHFIVYPDWMGCDALIGDTLHEATVTDATILGGQTMRASTALWDRLGSGERPWTKLETISDILDVADLESEAAHAYALFGARDGEQTVEDGVALDGATVLDGGRTNRVRERFVVKLPSGPLVGVARVAATAATSLRIRSGSVDLPPIAIASGPWVEVSFPLPETPRGDRVEIEIVSTTPFTSFHYWFGR